MSNEVDAVQVLDAVSQRFAAQYVNDQREIAVRDVIIADLRAELTKVQPVEGEIMPKQSARE